MIILVSISSIVALFFAIRCSAKENELKERNREIEKLKIKVDALQETLKRKFIEENN